ncbi:4-demethylwyosine synthase TYW1 [Candidatus Woesearchaeota archaeon]|nr:4-demethylwyosine synthase TYW1 [Candidatus Woesearchaeota archaeon]
MVEGIRRKDNTFVRQQYGQVGKHSVVKICGWTKKMIRCGESCYKHHFYGISTGRCLEMSPILICNQRCKHCWRDHSLFSDQMECVDKPKDIIEGCIAERRRLLIGFKGWSEVDLERLENCLVPKQAAISLTGEPCLYPKLPELVKGFYDFGFESVFLVTNGTVPAMLEKLSGLEKLPTNIYLSVEWWDKESYVDFCKPLEEEQYERILESMDILKELSEQKKTKTVLRITCVNGFNMDHVERFKWIVERMQPDYIECKGYMFVGMSRKRMEKENMPDHVKVKEFASELASLIGYAVKGDQAESRVVLLERK